MSNMHRKSPFLLHVRLTCIGIACFVCTSCAFSGLAPLAIEFIPTLLAAVKPIIAKAQNKSAAVAKAQTALDLLQTVNNGEFPTELEINAALINRGKKCLTDDEYVQIMNALGPAFQKLVVEAQGKPGGYELVKKRVSDAIVATQEELKK